MRLTRGMRVSRYDVVIVGAGLIGSVMAHSCASMGFSVCVLEKRHLKENTAITDRPLTLNRGSWQILQSLELLDQSLIESAVELDNIVASVQHAWGLLNFIKDKHLALGYVLSFAKLQSALWEKISAHPLITLQPLQEITALSQTESQVSLKYLYGGQEREVVSPWVLACDGSHSSLRDTWLKIPVVKGQPLACISAEVGLSDLATDMPQAIQRLTSQGILALLPGHQAGMSRLMWTCDPSGLDSLPLKDDQAMIHEVNAKLGRRWGQIKKWQLKACFQVPWIIAQQSHQGRVLLMGNAQHSIYPTSAQGFNLGLRDIAVLLQMIREAGHASGVIDIKQLLKRYDEVNLNNQKRNISLVKKLHAFSHGSLGLQILSKGFAVFNGYSPFKTWLENQMIGGHGYSYCLSGNQLRGVLSESIQII